MPKVLDKQVRREGIVVHDSLYKKGLSRISKRSLPKTSEEIEFEKGKEECTFKPSISANTSLIANSA